MPRYFFHVQHDGDAIVDRVGIDLPDDKTSWHQATTACGEMIRALDGSLEPGTEWRMDVKDDEQRLLFSLRFDARRHLGGPT